MILYAWRWLLLLFVSAYIQNSLAQGWCSFSSSKCEDTGEALKNLSCGWCRSWTFGTNIANNKLRMIGLDGGALPGDGNSSNNYMVELSLDQDVDISDGSAWQLTLLPSSVPKLKGSTLWSDSSNSTLFNYGGRSPGPLVPNGNDIPTLDTQSDQWSVATTLISIQRLAEGASVNALDINKAFYIGGYQSNFTSTDAPSDGLLHYTTSMFQFDTNTNMPSQIDAPFLPIQFGAASYIPVGGGALVYFGGESPSTPTVKPKDPYPTDLSVKAWDHAWVYDIEGEKWYKQSTTGTATPRTQFCTSTVYDAGSRSWQIWAIGGADFESGEVVDTVSILSIPSFQWFSAGAATARMSLSCQGVGSQIFVMGGRTEFTVGGGDDYDSVGYIYDTNKQASVSTFSPSSTAYDAPASVRSAISSASTPATWADPAVRALFVSSATVGSDSSSAITSAPPSASSSSDGGLSGGAIGGIVVGVVLGIAGAVALVVFLFFRRRKTHRADVKVDGSSQQPFMQEKTELDAEGTQRNGAHVPVEMATEHDGYYGNGDSAKPAELDNEGLARPKKQQNAYELA